MVILTLCIQEWSRSATRQCVGSVGGGVKEKKIKKKKKGTEYHDSVMTESEVNLVLAVCCSYCLFIFLNLHAGCR